MEWQPIDSAPRDGTAVLLWWPHWASRPVVGYYGFAGWDATEVIGAGPGPTHWLPLPPPPGEAPAADLPVRNARPRE